MGAFDLLTLLIPQCSVVIRARLVITSEGGLARILRMANALVGLPLTGDLVSWVVCIPRETRQNNGRARLRRQSAKGSFSIVISVIVILIARPRAARTVVLQFGRSDPSPNTRDGGDTGGGDDFRDCRLWRPPPGDTD